MKEYRIVATIGYYYPDGSMTIYEDTTPTEGNRSTLDRIFKTLDEAKKYLKKWRKSYPYNLSKGWHVPPHMPRRYQWGLHIQCRDVSEWKALQPRPEKEDFE